MFREKAVIASLIVLSFSSFQSYARTIDVNIRIRNDSSDEKVINRENLTLIKQLILNEGLRETYCQMYNNNPAYHTKHFSFYLNPDSGQQNINCEIDKSDFQTLVIRDPEKKNQYCHIAFHDEYYINISIPWPTGDLTVSQIREFAIGAIKEILSEIEEDTPVSKPDPTLGTDIKSLQDAVDIAISTLHDNPSVPAFDYTLTAAQQSIIEGKYIWRIVFKPTRFLPEDPSKELIALGGEVFVNVDLSTKATEITYGE